MADDPKTKTSKRPTRRSGDTDGGPTERRGTERGSEDPATKQGGTSHVIGQYDRVRQGGLRTDEEAREDDPPRADEDERSRARRHRRHD